MLINVALINNVNWSEMEGKIDLDSLESAAVNFMVQLVVIFRQLHHKIWRQMIHLAKIKRNRRGELTILAYI